MATESIASRTRETGLSHWAKPNTATPSLTHYFVYVDNRRAQVGANIFLEISHHWQVGVGLDVVQLIPLTILEHFYCAVGLPLHPDAAPVVSLDVLGGDLDAVDCGQIEVMA